MSAEHDSSTDVADFGSYEDNRNLFMDQDEIMKALETVWSSVASTGDPVPAGWKEEGKFLQGLTFVDVLQRTPFNLNAVSRADALVCYLKPVSKALKILLSLVDDLDSAQHRLHRMKPMCGFASLPNDVMVLIIDLAITPIAKSNPDEHLHSRRVLAAIRLSHISRYFRNLMLSFPQFWNQINIYPDCSDSLTEACIARTREAALNIHITVFVNTPENYTYYDAFRQVLLQAHRWRRVTLHTLRYRSTSLLLAVQNRESRQVYPMIMVDSEMGGISGVKLLAPLLQEICVEKETGLPRSAVETIASSFVWHTPKLRVLKPSRYFPYELSSLPSVTTLDFTIGRKWFDYPRLLRALGEMRALEDFHLCFEDGDEQRPNKIVSFKPTVLEKVVKFSLRVETRHLCKPDRDCEPERASSQGAFYAALIFPNATKLHLQFYGVSSPFGPSTTSIADDFLKSASTQFPCVSSLHFEIQERPKYFPRHSMVNQIISPALPIHHLRNLNRLVVQCNVPLYIMLRVDLPLLPALRNIHLYIKNEALQDASSNLRSWVAHLVARLQSQGIWDRFRELVLWKTERSGGKCPVELSIVEENISRDDVVAWCRAPWPVDGNEMES